MKISIESKTDFDYSVGTEDRFALRKWLERFAVELGRGTAEGLKEFFAEELTIEGFTEGDLDREGFLALLGAWTNRDQMVLRYPSLALNYKHYLFSAVGTFEGFIDGIIVLEGTIEFKIAKSELGNFTIVWQKFYPRMLPKSS
jgi:hypothetical protein